MTQASVAISADGVSWFVINASPDLRQQIEADESLQPSHGLRSSPIAGVVLTNGDVDAIAGLLHLREGTPFALYAHQGVLDILAANPVFGVINSAVVQRRAIELEQWRPLRFADGSRSGIDVKPFPVPGKVPLYLEDAADSSERPATPREDGTTIGLQIRAGSAEFAYLANCAGLTDALADRIAGLALLFFDGSFYTDDEMLRQGVGTKTAGRMGHMSLSGPDGSIEALQRLRIGRIVFIHINNTNPILLGDSPERQAVEASGFEVAYDGMEIRL